MYVCMYVCIYVYIYIYTYTHVCMYICMCVYMYICICMYVCVCVYIYIYIYIYIHTHTHICIYNPRRAQDREQGARPDRVLGCVTRCYYVLCIISVIVIVIIIVITVIIINTIDTINITIAAQLHALPRARQAHAPGHGAGSRDGAGRGPRPQRQAVRAGDGARCAEEDHDVGDAARGPPHLRAGHRPRGEDGGILQEGGRGLQRAPDPHEGDGGGEGGHGGPPSAGAADALEVR